MHWNSVSNTTAAPDIKCRPPTSAGLLGSHLAADPVATSLQSLTDIPIITAGYSAYPFNLVCSLCGQFLHKKMEKKRVLCLFCALHCIRKQSKMLTFCECHISVKTLPFDPNLLAEIIEYEHQSLCLHWKPEVVLPIAVCRLAMFTNISVPRIVNRSSQWFCIEQTGTAVL